MRRLGLGLKYDFSFSGSDVVSVEPRLFDTLGVTSVLSFIPYIQVIGDFSGPSIKCVRSVDFAEKDFSFVNGVLDSASIVSWANSGDVGVKRVYLQNDNTKYAYQDTYDYMPKIVVSGVFQSDGLLFDGVDDRLVIDNYSGLSIIEPPLSIYANYKRAASHVGFIFTRNTEGSDDVQYSMLNDGTNISVWWYGNERLLAVNQESNKDLVSWVDIYADGLKLNTNGNESTALFNPTLIDRLNTTVGARKNPSSYSSYFSGHVKSICVFGENVYNKYTDFVNGGL